MSVIQENSNKFITTLRTFDTNLGVIELKNTITEKEYSYDVLLVPVSKGLVEIESSEFISLPNGKYIYKIKESGVELTYSTLIKGDITDKQNYSPNKKNNNIIKL